MGQRSRAVPGQFGYVRDEEPSVSSDVEELTAGPGPDTRAVDGASVWAVLGASAGSLVAAESPDAARTLSGS